jgi:hypothetical protein
MSRIRGVEVGCLVPALIPEHRDRDPIEETDPWHQAPSFEAAGSRLGGASICIVAYSDPVPGSGQGQGEVGLLIYE